MCAHSDDSLWTLVVGCLVPLVAVFVCLIERCCVKGILIAEGDEWGEEHGFATFIFSSIVLECITMLQYHTSM